MLLYLNRKHVILSVLSTTSKWWVARKAWLPWQGCGRRANLKIQPTRCSQSAAAVDEETIRNVSNNYKGKRGRNPQNTPPRRATLKKQIDFADPTPFIDQINPGCAQRAATETTRTQTEMFQRNMTSYVEEAPRENESKQLKGIVMEL